MSWVAGNGDGLEHGTQAWIHCVLDQSVMYSCVEHGWWVPDSDAWMTAAGDQHTPKQWVRHYMITVPPEPPKFGGNEQFKESVTK